MRITVRIFSMIGLGIHLLFIMLLGAASGLSDTSSQASQGTLVLLASPFIYFGFCLVSSFGHWRSLSLLIGGLIAHLCIIPFLVRLFHDGVPFFGIPIVVMALCWGGMYYESIAKHDA
jgi:hypothetical protein